MDEDHSLIVWFTVIRAMHYIACMLMLCLLVFNQFLVERSFRGRWETIARGLFWFALPVATVSAVLWLMAVVADVSGWPLFNVWHWRLVSRVWNHTQFGQVWKIHAVLGLITIAAGMWRWKVDRSVIISVIGTVSALGFIASLAWAGHGRTGPHVILHLAADSLHLLAAACWPTGLLPLMLLLRGMKGSEVQRLIRRFSAMSLCSVGVLAITGSINSWLLLGSFANLIGTSYGRILAIKLTLFAVMFSFGAVNLCILKPRLIRLDQQPSAIVWIKLNVLLESLVAIALFVIVGLLGRWSPGTG